MANAQTVPDKEDFSYDIFPYESYPFAHTHPENLFAYGKLLGLDAPHFSKCRYLELGCAEGGNLIPSALDNPDAEFIGIDLSEKQIDEANRQVRDLGLENIKFYAMDIMDFDKSHGKFDYITGHGVFSWVPEQVRGKIMEICKNQLKDNGIGYLSYNVMPGWSSFRTLREMMMLHSRGAKNHEDKVNKCKQLIQFLYQMMPEEDTMRPAVEKVMKAISGKHETYFMHEYLDEDNRQYYFLDFNEILEKNDLKYLGDCDLWTMYMDNLPAKQAGILKQINNPLQQEQYADFIRRRQFRTTMFCRKNARIKQNISLNKMKGLYFDTLLTTDNTDQNINAAITYKSKAYNTEIQINNPSLNALLLTLNEAGGIPLSIEEMVEGCCQKTGQNEDEIRNFVMSQIVVLVFKRAAEITGIKPEASVHAMPDKPQAYELAQYQSRRGEYDWMTNMDHHIVFKKPLHSLFLPKCDGNTPLKDIKTMILKEDFECDKDLDKEETLDVFLQKTLETKLIKKA